MPTAVTPLAPIPSTRAPTDNDHEVDLGATTLELLGRGEAHLDLTCRRCGATAWIMGTIHWRDLDEA